MPSHDTYTVVVEFTTPTERAIGHEFTEANQFERVGSDHYQVGYTVAAPTPAEAYRRTVNLIEAKLAVAAFSAVSITAGHVYGTDGEEGVD